MKYILIALFLLVNTSYAESLWGLNQDTESRLSLALELLHENKSLNQNKAGVNFVTVGDDGTCDFRVGSNRIQNAIDSGASEIRIASNTSYSENIVIDTFAIDLNIRGGFADCTQAENNIQSNAIADRAEISHVNGQITSVFSVQNLPSSVTVSFENLKIMGGNSNSQGSGGGVSFSTTDADGIFNNVWITGTNKTLTGGGLSVVSSASTIILNNTDIFNNAVASNGGGIYCNNSTAQIKNSTIIMAQDSNLYSNTADGSAGGASVGNDCLLASFSGSKIINGQRGIYSNSAVNSAGAVSVHSGGNVLIYGHILCNIAGNCFGNSTDPASVYGNQANTLGINRNGGAFSASDTGTDITIVAGHVYANTINPNLTAFGAGGAISLTLGASLNIAHPGLNNSTVSCWDEDRCNLFNDNTARGGGVIYTNDAQVNISHAYFEDNRADDGMVFYFSGDEVAFIENTIINNNGDNGNGDYDDNNLIQATGITTINVFYSTIADNDSDQVVFDIGSSVTLNLQSSIIHDADSGNLVNATSGTINSNCVMAHEITSFSGTNNVLDDPEFIDRANRDYHLDASSDSPAIDYCTVFPNSLNKDIDYQERGYDDLSLSNNIGTYDLGADESFSKTFLTVGGDGSCDFNTATQSIQDAIDTGIGEVRIAANGNHNQSININNINIKLRGGYADCAAAIIDDNQSAQFGMTSIDLLMSSNNPTVTIVGNQQRNFILLEKLILTGAKNSPITAIGTNADIKLDQVIIQQNVMDSGFAGGAIFTSNSNAIFTLHDSIVNSNTAANGGGIFCSGSNTSIVLTGNSGIRFNTANGKGGGVFLSNGCQFTMYSGALDPGNLVSLEGIQRNTATEEGGGIYADTGAKVVLYGHQLCQFGSCLGDNAYPANVNDNRSDSDSSGNERGGGIYMTGLGTTVDIYAGLIARNIGQNGGGVYVNDKASLTVARLSKDCWDPVKCNYFHGNNSFATGGAIQNDQGFVNISSTYFEENEGSSGSVLYAFGNNSHNVFEGCVFNHNNSQGSSDDFVIRAAVSANVEISHSTFADNFITSTSVFGITLDSELRLFSSIVNEPDGDVLDANPGNVVSDCIMVHEAFSLGGTISSNLYIDDPEFTDRNNRDYHLNMSTSPAIDVCDDSMSALQFKDIDFDERGIDDINVNDVDTPFDIGADEAVINDIIFKNSFE